MELAEAVQDTDLDKISTLLQQEETTGSHRQVNLAHSQTGDTALITACEKGRLDLVKLLLSKGADVNVRDVTAGSALHAAASRDQVEVIEELCQHGAELNAINTGGLSALHVAVKKGFILSTKTLLRLGAQPNICDVTWYRTPLYDAVKLGNFRLAKLLLEKDALVNSQDSTGLTPLHEAVADNNLHLARLLLKYGANINLKEDITMSSPLEQAKTSEMKQLLTIFEQRASRESLRNRKYSSGSDSGAHSFARSQEFGDRRSYHGSHDNLLHGYVFSVPSSTSLTDPAEYDIALDSFRARHLERKSRRSSSMEELSKPNKGVASKPKRKIRRASYFTASTESLPNTRPWTKDYPASIAGDKPELKSVSMVTENMRSVSMEPLPKLSKRYSATYGKLSSDRSWKSKSLESLSSVGKEWKSLPRRTRHTSNKEHIRQYTEPAYAEFMLPQRRYFHILLEPWRHDILDLDEEKFKRGYCGNGDSSKNQTVNNRVIGYSPEQSRSVYSQDVLSHSDPESRIQNPGYNTPSHSYYRHHNDTWDKTDVHDDRPTSDLVIQPLTSNYTASLLHCHHKVRYGKREGNLEDEPQDMMQAAGGGDMDHGSRLSTESEDDDVAPALHLDTHPLSAGLIDNKQVLTIHQAHVKHTAENIELHMSEHGTDRLNGADYESEVDVTSGRYLSRDSADNMAGLYHYSSAPGHQKTSTFSENTRSHECDSNTMYEWTQRYDGVPDQRANITNHDMIYYASHTVDGALNTVSVTLPHEQMHNMFTGDPPVHTKYPDASYTVDYVVQTTPIENSQEKMMYDNDKDEQSYTVIEPELPSDSLSSRDMSMSNTNTNCTEKSGLQVCNRSTTELTGDDNTDNIFGCTEDDASLQNYSISTTQPAICPKQLPPSLATETTNLVTSKAKIVSLSDRSSDHQRRITHNNQNPDLDRCNNVQGQRQDQLNQVTEDLYQGRNAQSGVMSYLDGKREICGREQLEGVDFMINYQQNQQSPDRLVGLLAAGIANREEMPAHDCYSDLLSESTGVMRRGRTIDAEHTKHEYNLCNTVSKRTAPFDGTETGVHRTELTANISNGVNNVPVTDTVVVEKAGSNGEVEHRGSVNTVVQPCETPAGGQVVTEISSQGNIVQPLSADKIHVTGRYSPLKEGVKQRHLVYKQEGSWDTDISSQDTVSVLDDSGFESILQDDRGMQQATMAPSIPDVVQKMNIHHGSVKVDPIVTQNQKGMCLGLHQSASTDPNSDTSKTEVNDKAGLSYALSSSSDQMDRKCPDLQTLKLNNIHSDSVYLCAPTSVKSDSLDRRLVELGSDQILTADDTKSVNIGHNDMGHQDVTELTTGCTQRLHYGSTSQDDQNTNSNQKSGLNIKSDRHKEANQLTSVCTQPLHYGSISQDDYNTITNQKPGLIIKSDNHNIVTEHTSVCTQPLHYGSTSQDDQNTNSNKKSGLNIKSDRQKEANQLTSVCTQSLQYGSISQDDQNTNQKPRLNIRSDHGGECFMYEPLLAKDYSSSQKEAVYVNEAFEGDLDQTTLEKSTEQSNHISDLTENELVTQVAETPETQVESLNIQQVTDGDTSEGGTGKRASQSSVWSRLCGCCWGSIKYM